ncbi:hypothetical protein QAD02_002231 [Eretmocerus hayati]|uniref:Uncharacterized protein n=1 Tax=Eretmocerus hayati TaxID=131215 RepID=A0ACC2NIP0_9HYME|nr:hypothetical protein QAD02_002231 [Eretmocerus hayati]
MYTHRRKRQKTGRRGIKTLQELCDYLTTEEGKSYLLREDPSGVMPNVKFDCKKIGSGKESMLLIWNIQMAKNAKKGEIGHFDCTYLARIKTKGLYQLLTFMVRLYTQAFAYAWALMPFKAKPYYVTLFGEMKTTLKVTIRKGLVDFEIALQDAPKEVFEAVIIGYSTCSTDDETLSETLEQVDEAILFETYDNESSVGELGWNETEESHLTKSCAPGVDELIESSSERNSPISIFGSEGESIENATAMNYSGSDKNKLNSPEESSSTHNILLEDETKGGTREISKVDCSAKKRKQGALKAISLQTNARHTKKMLKRKNLDAKCIKTQNPVKATPITKSTSKGVLQPQDSRKEGNDSTCSTDDETLSETLEQVDEAILFETYDNESSVGELEWNETEESHLTKSCAPGVDELIESSSERNSPISIFGSEGESIENATAMNYSGSDKNKLNSPEESSSTHNILLEDETKGGTREISKVDCSAKKRKQGALKAISLQTNARHTKKMLKRKNLDAKCIKTQNPVKATPITKSTSKGVLQPQDSRKEGNGRSKRTPKPKNFDDYVIPVKNRRLTQE